MRSYFSQLSKSSMKQVMILFIFAMLLAPALALMTTQDKAVIAFPEPNDFNVTWRLVQDGIIHKVYLVDVQNLLDTNVEIDILSLFENLSFNVSELRNVKFYEWKDWIQVEVPIYDDVAENYTIENVLSYENITSLENENYSHFYGDWNEPNYVILKVSDNRENVAAGYENIDNSAPDSTYIEFTIRSIVGYENKIKNDWKPCKMLMFEQAPKKYKENYGTMLIPKFGSKPKYDNFSNAITENGTKHFRLEFDVPVQSSANGWGSSGKVALIIDNVEHHPWWDMNWPYRVTITLTIGENVPQENYQYKIVLSNADNLGGHISFENFQDLRFLEDENSGELSFWIENYIDGDNAIFWVKREDNSLDDNTIYCYYGNASAGSAEDASATFNFFDDFEDGTMDKWTAEADWSIESGSPIEGSYSLYFNRYADSGAWIKNNSGTGEDVELTVKVKMDGTKPDCRNISVRFDGDTGSPNCYDAGLQGWDDDFRLTKHVDGSGATLQSTYYEFSAGGTWFVKVRAYGSSVTVELYDTDWNLLENLSDTDTDVTGAGLIGFRCWGGQVGSREYWFDRVYLRNYVSPEPSVSVGVEESGMPPGVRIGYENIGQDRTWQKMDEILTGSKFVAPVKGELKSITAYLAQRSSKYTPNIKYAIYDDNSGYPENLVGYTENWTMTGGWDDWKMLNIETLNENLVEDDNYWLIVWGNNRGYLYYDTGDANQGVSKSNTYGVSFPENFPSGGDTSTRKYSIYGTYESAPGQPELISPPDNTKTADITPTLEWYAGINADNHTILVDDDENCLSPIDNNVVIMPTVTWTKTEGSYAEGTYYWKVIAVNDMGENTSSIWTFEVVGEAASVTTENATNITDITATLNAGISYGDFDNVDIQFELRATQFDNYVPPIDPATAGNWSNRTPIKYVVASDSSQEDKDFVTAQGENGYSCDGSNDQAEINQAIEALSGGGRVILFSGTYYVNAEPVRLNESDVTLQGDNKENVKVKVISSLSNVIRIGRISASPIQNILLENLTVIGRGWDYPIEQSGVHIRDGANIVVRDVIAKDLPAIGIYGELYPTKGLNNVWIKNCHVENTADGGITIANHDSLDGRTFENFYILNNTLYRCGLSDNPYYPGPHYSIGNWATKNSVIANNIIEDSAGDSIVITTDTDVGRKVENILIQGNRIFNSGYEAEGSAAIDLHAEDYNNNSMMDVFIRGNDIFDNLNDNQVYGINASYYVDNVTINNNTFDAITPVKYYGVGFVIDNNIGGWDNTKWGTTTEATYSENVSGLYTGETYEYRAIIKYGGDTDEGSIITFKTLTTTPPVIKNLYITDMDNVAANNLILQTRYKFWVEIQDNETLADIENVTLVIYLDNENLADNVVNHYTFRWTMDNGFEEVGPDGSNHVTLDGATDDGWITSAYFRDSSHDQIKTGFVAEPYTLRRGYIEWDISSIPDDATITNVVFKYNGVSSDIDCHIHEMLGARPSTSADGDVYDEMGEGTVYVDQDGFPIAGTNQQIDLGTSADSDLQAQLSVDWFAIGLQSDSEETEGTSSIYSTDRSAPIPKPTLYVEYVTNLIIENCENFDNTLTIDNIIFVIKFAENAQLTYNDNWDVWVQVYDSTSNEDNRFFLNRFDIVSTAPVNPTKPVLYLPENNSFCNNNRPYFEWTCGENADNHRLLVDDNSEFPSPIDNILLGATDNTWTKEWTDYSENHYWWMITSINENGENNSDVGHFIILGSKWIVPDSVENKSGEEVGYEATKAIDENIETYWNHADLFPWIFFDMGQSVKMSQFVIYQHLSDMTLRFGSSSGIVFYISDNTDNWGDTVGSHILNAGGLQTIGDFEKIGRYIKMTSSSAYSTQRLYGVWAYVVEPHVKTENATNVTEENATLNATIEYATYENVDIRFEYKSDYQCYTEGENENWFLSDHYYDAPTDPATAGDWGNRLLKVVAAYDSSAEDKASADYVCDGIGDNDQEEINSAITFGGGYGGAYLCSGTYIIGNFIVMKNNRSLIGSGRDNTTIKNVGTGYSGSKIISQGWLFSLQNVLIENLTVIGRGRLTSGEVNGINFRYGNGIVLRNLLVKDISCIAIYFETLEAAFSKPWEITNCWVIGCEVRNIGHAGIVFAKHQGETELGNNYILNNTVVGAAMGGSDYGGAEAIGVYSAKHMVIANNIVENCGRRGIGIIHGGTTVTHGSENILVQGNRLRHNCLLNLVQVGESLAIHVRGGINQDGENHNTFDVTIRGNDIDQFWGIRFEERTKNNIVDNNSFYNTVVALAQIEGEGHLFENNTWSLLENSTSWTNISDTSYSENLENLYHPTYYGYRARIKFDGYENIGNWIAFRTLGVENGRLYKPANYTNLDNTSVDFIWINSSNAAYHTLVVSTNKDFSGENEVNVNFDVPTCAYNVTLDDNSVYWYKVIAVYGEEENHSVVWIFGVNKVSPSIENIYITDIDDVTISNLNPLTEYRFRVEVEDNDNLSSIENVILKVYLDNVDLSDNKRNHYTFTFANTTGSWSSSPSGYIITENCVAGDKSKSRDNFIFAIKLNGVAHPTAFDNWDVWAEVEGVESDNKTFENKLDINVYYSIALSSDVITFRGWPGDTDIVALENPIIAAVVSNVNFDHRVSVSSGGFTGDANENLYCDADGSKGAGWDITLDNTWQTLYSNQSWTSGIDLYEYYFIDIPENLVITQYLCNFYSQVVPV